MTGGGFRTFAANEVLTAARVQDFFMDQAVMNFAGTAARAAALPSPSAGMVSHIGGGTVQVYNGTAWVALGGVPNAVLSNTATGTYTDGGTAYAYYTFTASVYNPYNYKVEYQWLFPINTEYVKVTDTVLTNSSLHLYFTKPMKEAPLALVIILNGDTTNVQKNFLVEDQATNSVLFRITEADMRQRIFGEKAEEAKTDGTAKELLDAEQDTFQVYNGYAFYLSDMQTLFPNLQGFHIANRKFYYRADGLWIANIDGTNQVQIDSLDCYAMTLDKKDNRIYWANEKGVWYMPFIGSDNNKFVTVPVQLNTLTDVTLIAADNELK